MLNKRIINKEIQDIKAKTPIKYVHLGGTEILIKACFREEIDTPIEIYLADDRIIHPIQKSVISAVKGNLMYQKFKFIISANLSRPKTSREWHPHVPYYVSEPTNLNPNISTIINRI